MKESIRFSSSAMMRMSSAPLIPGAASGAKNISYGPSGRSSILHAGAKKDVKPSSVVHAAQTSATVASTRTSPVIARSMCCVVTPPPPCWFRHVPVDAYTARPSRLSYERRGTTGRTGYGGSV